MVYNNKVDSLIDLAYKKGHFIPKLHFSFDYFKATQALDYFAIEEGGLINKMKALKLVYFADRYHLRKYGRMITNDNYLAMDHGPVPSTTKDIAQSNDYLDDTIKTYSLSFIEPINNLTYKTINKLDKSVLSESDLEALKFSWDTFGYFDQYELRDLTHFYPEWLRVKDYLANVSCLPMDLLDFLKDPVDDVNKCYTLNNKAKSIRSEQLAESAYIDSLWRQDARCAV